MTANPLRSPTYRPSFSGHETFPLRYGWPQKAYEAVASADTKKEANKIFRDQSSIARFGVGRNMVTAMRHWAIAAGLVEETEGAGLTPSWLGDLFFGQDGVDPYLEEMGSVWLLHWHLASHPKLTTVYWLFNEFSGGVFTRKDISAPLVRLAEELDWQKTAETTIDRDVQCILRTYIGGRGESEAGDSVLAELGLVRPLGSGRFSLSRGQQDSLLDEVFLFAVWDFWQRTAQDRTTLSYEMLAFEGGSPGRVFLLDEAALVDRLETLSQVSKGAFSWSETAGLRQLVRSREPTFEEVTNAMKAGLIGQTRNRAA